MAEQPVEHLEFDLDALTLGDIVDLEEATGISVQGLDLRQPPMKVAVALIWIFKRKHEPGFTYRDALALRFNAIDFDGLAAEVAAPKDPVALPARSSSTSSRRSSSSIT